MAIVFDSDAGTITGLSVGGLPDGTVDAGTLATNSVTAAKIATDAVTAAKIPASLENTFVSGRKNMVINGAMQVAQRGTSFTGLGASDLFSLDRYKFDFGGTDGRLTAEQSTDAPSGFSHSLKLSCTTADTSVAVSSKARIIYAFEGQDLKGIGKGTSDAKAITASFYVKGNAAATYVCEFYDNDNDRQCSKLFNVTTAWTKVELTFPADTTGAFTYDNSVGGRLSFWFMAGSERSGGTLNSSAFATSVVANRVAGCDNFFDSTNRTLQITGVQLEVGETATDFEHRSYGEELALCQRYYEIFTGGICTGSVKSSTAADAVFQPKVTKRATPSISVSGTFYANDGSAQQTASLSSSTRTNNGIIITIGFSSLNTGRACIIYTPSVDHKLIADAEL